LSRPILTIGYGKRDIDEFIHLLRKYNIQYLVDVRSRPVSKFNPSFSRVSLEKVLWDNGIRYVFMGDNLGGQPKDEDCYTDGKVDYKKVSSKNFYKQGINRLNTAWEKQLGLALMCSESRPQDCHRCKLIGETLENMRIGVEHINEKGQLVQHQQIIQLLTGGQLGMFDGYFTSRKRYK
jgi:uncharacterized protein (DUF488 family)